MARAYRLEATMDDIARATADGLMHDAKGAAGDLAVKLQCECPVQTLNADCALTIEREQVPRRVREDRPDTLAVEREESVYSRIPFQSAGARHDLCACYVGKV